jgi:hypothetical protein
MLEALASRRLQAVRRLEATVVSVELLEAVARHPGIRELVLEDANLALIDAGLLARLAGHLEEVFLPHSSITQQQVDAIFSVIDGDSALRRLHMSSNNLSLVEPALLARAVCSLEEAHLNDTYLTFLQLMAISIQIDQKESRLKKLNLGFNISTAALEPTRLAEMVSKLEEIDIQQNALSPQHVKEIIDLINGDSRLRSLNIGGSDLTTVEPSQLVRAARHLQQLHLNQSLLTRRQMTAILTVVRDGNSKLRILDVASIDMSFADPKLLARAVKNLEEVVLYDTHLTKDQVKAIITALKSGSRLRKLDIAGNNLDRMFTSPYWLDKAWNYLVLKHGLEITF